MMALLLKEYKDKDGIIYPHVKELRYKRGEILLEGAKFITATSHSFIDSKFQYMCDDLCGDIGVHIYQSNINKNEGYRIDIEYNDPFFNDKYRAELVERLQKSQPNVKLTQFPYGVITFDSRVIGEIMPFYPDTLNIYDYLFNNSNKNILEIYSNILEILKELYINGVLYRDIHVKNILVDNFENPTVHLIDFQSEYLDIDNISSDKKQIVFENLMRLLNILKDVINNEKTHSEMIKMTKDFNIKVLKK